MTNINTGSREDRSPLTLLIDGNNLAHFLYTNLTPGQKMTPGDSRRLIAHISDFARTYREALRVELCMDRSPGDYDLPVENVALMFAEYPQTADDLLLGRFWFHTFSHQPCLVITNDEGILEEVAEAGGSILRVYDFVRRPGLVSPVFRAPDELPALEIPSDPPEKKNGTLSLHTSTYFRIIEEERLPRKKNPSVELPASQVQVVNIKPHSSDLRKPMALNGLAPKGNSLPAGGEALPVPEPADPVSKETVIKEAVETSAAKEGPYYFLSLERWPIGEGVRFLLNAFCPQHRARYEDFMNEFGSDTLQPADLQALAELLLHTCGDESDFARRGALMNRVRLALLQARGEPLSLNQLAEKTGLKTQGLRGRIKEKAGRWIEILTLD